jgi:protein-tyrosine-phosphatase
MSIGVICRMNQARSIFVEGVLTKNFPELDFFSSGVEAVSGSAVIDGVEELAKTWEIELTKKRSSTIQEDMPEILEAELIICTEMAFEQAIRLLGYSGKVLNFEQLVTDSFFMPLDPEGLFVDKFRRELAKAAAISIKAVRSHLGLSFANPIKVVTPNSAADSNLALAHSVMEAKIDNAILIDADFRAPNLSEIKEQGLETVEFDIKNFDQKLLEKITNQNILTHQYQINHPGQILLNPLFANFLQILTQDRPIVLLTAPRYTNSLRLSDSYIFSAYTDNISVISA